MVPILTKQKTIYKNLMKKVEFHTWLANFPTIKFPDQNNTVKNKNIVC